MKRLVTTVLSTIFCGSLFWACSESTPSNAGATSETTNGIALTVVDAAHKPVARAKLTLYSKKDISVQRSTESDSLGQAYFDTLMTDAFVEGIAGADSSMMAWVPLDTNKTEIPLLPSASLTVRTGASEESFANLSNSISLDSTPYAALRNGGDYVFPHVPAGIFDVIAGDSLLATVSIENGTAADTLFNVPGITREFVFEDFDDGDSLNNFAKEQPNYGWYFFAPDSARWIRPDSSMRLAKAIANHKAQGKFLSLEFNLKGADYVLLGTHLGLDTGYYDLSRLTAIRLKVRGNCEFNVALEHYKKIGENSYRKALWNAKASSEWSEIVLRPGKEILEEKSLQVPWAEISNQIGIFSIFVRSGTTLDIDEIVFEGIDSISL